jgi:hypothetical protein
MGIIALPQQPRITPDLYALPQAPPIQQHSELGCIQMIGHGLSGAQDGDTPRHLEKYSMVDMLGMVRMVSMVSMLRMIGMASIRSIQYYVRY